MAGGTVGDANGLWTHTGVRNVQHFQEGGNVQLHARVIHPTLIAQLKHLRQ